jgi:hypothetical protein
VFQTTSKFSSFSALNESTGYVWKILAYKSKVHIGTIQNTTCSFPRFSFTFKIDGFSRLLMILEVDFGGWFINPQRQRLSRLILGISYKLIERTGGNTQQYSIRINLIAV